MMDVITIVYGGIAVASVVGAIGAAHEIRRALSSRKREPILQPWEVPTLAISNGNAGEIDWSKPLELVDGTPLVFNDPGAPMDSDGDYLLVREDGKLFTEGQHPGHSLDYFCAAPNGKWWFDEARDEAAPLVRNRVAVPANENLPALTVNQCAVLCEMSGDIGYTAATLARRTGLQLDVVVEVRRELRRLGLANFGPLLDDVDGRLMGRGYTLTAEAVQIRERLLDGEVIAA